MKVWIPGGSGMLASHVKNVLDKNAIPYVATHLDDIDITIEKQVVGFAEKQRFSHIINCAAYTRVDQAEREQEKAFLANAIGPEILGKAALSRAKIIHFSTDYVFDGSGQDPYREEDPCTPLSFYGKSKLEGETRLLAANPKACILRTSWLYGMNGNNFVDTMIRLMQEKTELKIIKDQIGRPTYAQDLAEAALSMLDCSGIYHFANAQKTSWYEFSKEIYREIQSMGVKLKVQKITPIATQDYPSVAKRPLNSVLSTLKIAKHLGHEPRPWREALKDYLRTCSKSSDRRF